MKQKKKRLLSRCIILVGTVACFGISCERKKSHMRNLVEEETWRIENRFVHDEWPKNFWLTIASKIKEGESLTGLRLLERFRSSSDFIDDREFKSVLRSEAFTLDFWGQPYRFGKECFPNKPCVIRVWSCGLNRVDDLGGNDDILVTIAIPDASGIDPNGTD